MAKAKVVKKTIRKVRVTSNDVNSARKPKKSAEPSWLNCQQWPADIFAKHFRETMEYYGSELNSKTAKSAVIQWMTQSKWTKENISAIKKINDWRISLTMGGVASCLLKGMQLQRLGFNSGRNTAEWLKTSIITAIERGINDIEDSETEKPQVNIQARIKDIAVKMVEPIEDLIESWQEDADAFNNAKSNVLEILRKQGVKAAHARFIKEFYINNLNELLELAGPTPDPQLREAYSHRSRKQIRKLITLYQDVMSACDMLSQEAKIAKKPRIKRVVSNDKLVAKVKYKKFDEELKLTSNHPSDIIGKQQLWVYDSRSRKLGCYVADEGGALGIKGTSITGFDPVKSIQRTLRTPLKQLLEFKTSNKVALRTFLTNIDSVEIKLTGRLNENVLLLKLM